MTSRSGASGAPAAVNMHGSIQVARRFWPQEGKIMSEIQNRHVVTNGFNTHYLHAGQGTPVMLIHGGGAGADSQGNWTTCIPFFAASRQVFAPDMVGFGRSDCPDSASFTYDQDARTAQMIAFIEALDLGPVDIVGNSMGGATALGVAMKRPDLVQNLVLMGSAGLNHGVSDALKPVINYDFTFEGMQKVVAALANPDFVPTTDMLNYRYELSIQPQVMQAYKATTLWVKNHGGLFYEESEIAAIKHRTLVFNGKNDMVIPMKEAYRFLELLENSHGYFLPNCRHWAMIEYPEIFAKVTLAFLDGYR
jgi:pimeloyl-ACP methyl ester carboxylesterase